MRIARTLLLLLPLYPSSAFAYGYKGQIASPPLVMGDYFKRTVLACWNKDDLWLLVNPKTADSALSYLLLKSRFACDVISMSGYLVKLERKFKAADGRYFWIIGVSGGEDKPSFYITLPAEDIKRAP